jgi:acetylglutamate kinase
MNRLTIVKVGGKVVENPETLNAFLTEFKKISGNKILVHGGGVMATALAGRLGIETKMVDGRRITDSSMLDIVLMVYAGLVNKKIVAGLQALASNAIGLTGADLDVVRARKRQHTTIDFGFVGDVEEVNTSELRLLLEESVVPVIAPITHDGNGQLLNTNADTIAAAMAIELSNYYNVYLVICFDKKGVLSDQQNDDSIISHLSPEDFEEFKESGIVDSGMIPKLENGFNARKNGVREVIITNAENISTGKGTRLILDK